MRELLFKTRKMLPVHGNAEFRFLFGMALVMLYFFVEAVKPLTLHITFPVEEMRHLKSQYGMFGHGHEAGMCHRRSRRAIARFGQLPVQMVNGASGKAARRWLECQRVTLLLLMLTHQ